jgi:Histidine ammonia-lyase
VRESVPELEVDRFLAPDLEKGIALVRSGALEAVIADGVLPAL